MQGKVAVLGDNDFVMPFSALGLDTFGVENESDSVQKAAQTILSEKYALVVVAENVAEAADVVFQDVDTKPTPAVVVVPFTSEPEGFALASLGKVLKMATGIDIIN